MSVFRGNADGRCEVNILTQTRHHEPAPHAVSSSLDAPQGHVLLVGTAVFLDTELAFHLFGQRLPVAISKATTLIDALSQVEARTASLVLLGDEFREDAVSLFVFEARRHGFTGLILHVASLASQPEALAASSRPNDSIDQEWSGKSTVSPTKIRVGEGMQLENISFSKLSEGTVPPSHRIPSLTTRERMVLRYVSEGWSNKEIGHHLQCSEAAVKAVLQQLFGKLGVRKRAHVVRKAFENSLLADPAANKALSESRILIGDFAIDQSMHRVFVRNAEVALSPREFELLEMFCKHPDQVLKYEKILEMLGHSDIPNPKTLRSVIHSIRAKIEKDRKPQYIITVPSLGYQFHPAVNDRPQSHQQ
jgi:DNA-binding NarL/FixJ family response regulator/DNA-binding winged helix-turn-helix (wHTH) protein